MRPCLSVVVALAMVILPITVSLIVGLTKSDMLDVWFELSKCDNQVTVHLQVFNDRLESTCALIKSNMFDL